jgi:hypothetical protein
MATQRGRGRPTVAVKHTPCAFTFTIPKETIAALTAGGTSENKAKHIARAAAFAALNIVLQQQQKQNEQ